jgi:hypothetical protein
MTHKTDVSSSMETMIAGGKRGTARVLSVSAAVSTALNTTLQLDYCPLALGSLSGSRLTAYRCIAYSKGLAVPNGAVE